MGQYPKPVIPFYDDVRISGRPHLIIFNMKWNVKRIVIFHCGGCNFPGWRVCDDSHVMDTSAKHVVTKAAYVMFYKKRNACSSEMEQVRMIN